MVIAIPFQIYVPFFRHEYQIRRSKMATWDPLCLFLRLQTSKSFFHQSAICRIHQVVPLNSCAHPGHHRFYPLSFPQQGGDRLENHRLIYFISYNTKKFALCSIAKREMAGVEGFEPSECQSQNLVPYHLATPQYQKPTRALGQNGWAGWIRTIGMTESKSAALPLGYNPLWES